MISLLLFSDVHCDGQAARQLVERAAAADVVVGAGDFATMRAGLDRVIGVLRAIRRPTILVPGNSETVIELREACRDWPETHVLHGSAAHVAGLDFFGLGGAVPVTPFGAWSYDFTEDEADRLLADCPVGGVLVSHSPPKGVLDTDSSGRSLGSDTVRRAIFDRRPRLVVCGHIHACQGRQAILGDSVVINAGPEGVEWKMSLTRSHDARETEPT